MTIEEYNARIEKCNSVIKAMEAERIKIRGEFANEKNAKYSEYVGKKVRIIGHSKYRNAVDVIGFFQGFVAGRYYPLMKVFKVRKDGTKSHNEFPSWKLPWFDDLFTIEIVE